MSYFKIFIYALFFSCLSGKINAQNITIDDQKTPQQLIENILVNSACVSVTNVSGTGDTFTPGQNSYAYFTSGNSSFPFSDGVVLTTSRSKTAIGPYLSELGEGDPDWKGDPDLNQQLGVSSVNATVLEFDFIPLTDFLSFNYIFASNEYQSFYPCRYSDGFAFLIKEAGSSDAYQNLAVLPNTKTPVSSTNVRPKIAAGIGINGTPYEGCDAVNENYFNGLNTNASPINYAGQTVVMNAQTNLITGKKYHVKLIIADDQNRYYDSAVFLQAGSFSSKIEFGPDQTSLNGDPVCFGTIKTLNTNLSPSYAYKWYKDGILIPLATGPSYNTTETGTYKVEATLTPSICTLTGEVKIEFAAEILTTDIPLFQCDADTDGIAVFNLNKVNTLVKNNNSEILNSGYYESLSDAEAKINSIANPEKYSNKTPNQVIFSRIENKYGCFKIAKVTLQTSNNPIATQNPVATCDEDDKQDGFYQFDLNSEVTPQIVAGLPNGMTVNYYLSNNDALSETNQLPNIYKNVIAFNQTIYARIINGADCYNITPIKLVVNTFDPANFKDESAILCKGDTIKLTVATGFSSYLWNDGTTNNSIDVTVSGDYSVTVKDGNGCSKTKNFKVILSEPAIITDAIVKDFSGIDNSVLIQYTGVGNYEFSLDRTAYQDNPLFTVVKPGIYTATARDKNGCGISNSFLLYVLDYPRFFTPNGDGYNDLWAIKYLDLLPDYKISIFDRYGKLLKQMDQSSPGWNGIFNGQQLPSDDYWFTLIFENGTGIKGHFSLKR